MMKNKTTFIYTLSTEEEPNNIRYIGKTNNPKDRLKRHTQSCYLIEGTYKANWLKSELNKGRTPILTVIDEVPLEEWQMWEKYWIEQFKSWGFNLTNGTKGGDGCDWSGKKHSEHTINKLREISNKKQVCMFNLNGDLLNTFESIKEASRITSIHKKHISSCCNNKPHYNTVSGYVFKFKGDSFILKEAILNRIPVVQKDKEGNVIANFISISEASKKTGLSESHIGAGIKGFYHKGCKVRSVGGYIFERS